MHSLVDGRTVTKYSAIFSETVTNVSLHLYNNSDKTLFSNRNDDDNNKMIKKPYKDDPTKYISHTYKTSALYILLLSSKQETS